MIPDFAVGAAVLRRVRALFLASIAALVASALAQAPARPEAGSATTLDISKPLADLPGIQPTSAPAAVAAAIQARLDYLWLNSLPGRVVIPKGHWQIDRPIFMNGDNKEVVGEGVGATIVEAADGYRAMPMFNLGARTHFDERPLQACNRVRLTDPAARVLDASVPSERFGLRTYAEYPATNFPAVSHLAAFTAEPAPWKAETAYQVNDIVSIALPATPRPLQAVCVLAHTAAAGNQPCRAPLAEWGRYWVLKVPAHVQFFADPFTAGAYDPTAKRAGNWGDMPQFTLDFAFALNAAAKVYPQARMLCGTVMGETSRPDGRVWMLLLHPDGRLTFDFTLANHSTRSLLLARDCGATGVYRLALQVDFGAPTDQPWVQAWLRRPGDADFVRTGSDNASLPPGARFNEMEYGYFGITGADTGNAPCANGNLTPPTDLTVCGLHMSATLRYTDDAALRRRDTGAPADDLFRYFTGDAGTMAFLPLTENPPAEQLRTAGLLVSVQHGDAAGDAKQKGYGYFKVPAQVTGVIHPRISDMTLRPGPVWGMGLVTWHTLDARLSNLDIRGGFYAIGDLFFGAQYTFDIRDCLLAGSEAAFNGSSNIVLMRNVTIAPVGRCGILVSGSNIMLDGVTFADPVTHRSQYYFRHLATALYGGMNLLTNVRAEAPAGSGYPSRAAVSQETIWIFRTSMVMRDCAVANMGPDAALLELPYATSPCPAKLLVENCSYRGGPIAAWVRADSPWWSGQVTGFDPHAPVGRYLDFRPPPIAAWRDGTKYGAGASVVFDGKLWQCGKEHAALPANQPGTPGGAEFWQPVLPRILFAPGKGSPR